MSAEILQALNAVAERVMAIAEHDAELRTHLRTLAQAFLSATAEPPPQPTAPVAAEVIAPPSSESVDALEPDHPTAFQPEGASTHPVPSSSADSSPPLSAVESPSRFLTRPLASEIDLSLIEARCRLKAEGCRWAVARRRKLAEGISFRTEIDPQDRDIIARAKALPDCFLWMNTPVWQCPEDVSLVEDAAGCFEAVADIVALVGSSSAELDDDKDVFRQALELVAEAQSALRAAVLRISGAIDNDQIQVFTWLRATTDVKKVFLPRFMRVEDPANPREWKKLAGRIDALNKDLEEARKRERRRKKLLGNLRYKARMVNLGDRADRQERWQALVAATEELIQAGLPPSNLEIRELLLPLLDDMPELPELPRGFQLVLREIGRYRESRQDSPDDAEPFEPTVEVREAARLLSGKSMVLIGGDSRPDAANAMKTAFGLKELYWIETREHESLEGFEPYVARSDVAVVLLAIRWSSHSYGDVRLFCDKHDKPLVRLPAGYHPNQVAHQILSQCGERLASRA